MSDDDNDLITDETARDVVRLGMLAIGAGLIFWLGVIVAIVYLIVHFLG